MSTPAEIRSAPPRATAAAVTAPPAWDESLDAYARLLPRRDERSSMLLEALLEDLYAQACHLGPDFTRELAGVLASPAAPAASAAWRALLQLGPSCDQPALAALDRALAQSPPRSAWLVASESARLVYRAEGPEAAWRRVAAIEPVPAAEPWLDDGPLVIQALLLKTRLAAAGGHWSEHDRALESACARFGDPRDPRVLRLRLAGADHDLMRGRYQSAARALDRLEGSCRGDLRYALLAIRLHAWVACAGPQRDTRVREAIERTAAALDEADRSQTLTDDAYRLPPDERTELVRRVEQLVELADISERDIAPERVVSSAEALAVERRVREQRSERPPLETLAALLPRVEALLREQDAAEPYETRLRLRLLWCRLVVDLGHLERYQECLDRLTEIIEEVPEASYSPLVMSAYDQRAVLYAQAPFNAWDKAVADAGEAGLRAVTLLADNARPGGDPERILARALLGTLSPVLDRVIDLLIGGAFAWEPDGGRARDGWDRARRERWRRFGRAVHDYVEQSQALALQEARRAYGAGDTPTPHRFALAAPGVPPSSPLPALRRALGARDTVLQYFVTGRFVVVFAYTRRSFDWVLVDAVTAARQRGAVLEEATAHASLLHLLDECDTWLKGDSAPTHEARAAPLAQMLLPAAITALLHRGRRAHVRLVPHDVLYRVPFGRLPWRERGLRERCSLSLHPTAGLAAESAQRPLQARRQKRLGYVFDPSLGSAEAERVALCDGLGSGVRLARMESIDTAQADSTDEVIARIRELDVLHLACHGTRPVGRREAFIRLGTGRWRLSELASLHMRRCALAVLQSCWTGWMEHERKNPVQGFPQALCDAGVGAVIAPLVKVPDTLTPVFAAVLYRALRFRRAERALNTALAVLRCYGATLVADDPEARRDWEAFGPHDTLEYRYVGHTHVNLGGGYLARFVGWLSFWWWRRDLRRRHAARERGASDGPADARWTAQ